MFELLVPAEKAQLDSVNGDKKTYDLEIRPGLMVKAIQQQTGRLRMRGPYRPTLSKHSCKVATLPSIMQPSPHTA
jgi:hypothetical protein